MPYTKCQRGLGINRRMPIKTQKGFGDLPGNIKGKGIVKTPIKIYIYRGNNDPYRITVPSSCQNYTGKTYMEKRCNALPLETTTYIQTLKIYEYVQHTVQELLLSFTRRS